MDPVVQVVSALLVVGLFVSIAVPLASRLMRLLRLDKRFSRWTSGDEERVVICLLFAGLAWIAFEQADLLVFSERYSHLYISLEPWVKTCSCSVALVVALGWLSRKLNWTKLNWQGQPIPAFMGACFPFVWMLSTRWRVFWIAGDPKFEAANRGDLIDFMPVTNWNLVLLLVSFGVLGLIDDLWGSRETGGLKGHFRLLFLQKRLTTGVIKAVGGCGLAFLLAYRWHMHWELTTSLVFISISAAAIALCANTVNLLDVRPSRALKGFAALLLALRALALWLPFPRPSYVFTWPALWTNTAAEVFLMLLPVVVYAPLDFRSKAMMGDVGSNALGALAGWYAMTLLSLPGQVILVALLLALHLWTEKHSVTEFLSRHPVLDFLDRVGTGRKRGANAQPPPSLTPPTYDS